MQKDEYWFPSKTYGWGWGLPVRWQGWLVYGVALVLLISLWFVFPPATDLVAFMISTWGVILVLVAVCWLKGEPPRWRWGK
ncbi:hypothetical protein CSC70_01000 [Pseudoxanthomonas kalamensis DSM 18571]|nr:hypothetical protein CSC70_01000 [Pseudoxanthomonas kalamensis DSM 18571]